MTQLEQAEQWLKAMQAALDDKNKSRAIELDDINQESKIDWALMPQEISSKYEEIVEKYLDLVLYS